MGYRKAEGFCKWFGYRQSKSSSYKTDDLALERQRGANSSLPSNPDK